MGKMPVALLVSCFDRVTHPGIIHSLTAIHHSFASIPMFRNHHVSRGFQRVAALCVVLFSADLSQAAVPEGRTEKLSLNQGWKFHEGDIPFPEIKGHGNSYNNAKAGKSWGAAAPEFDDSQWRVLDLPHDWAVEQPFLQTANLSQGYRPRGFGWYRRSFKLDPSDRGKALELQFDGIATHCTVWLNGTLVHRNWCGYTSFQIDLTPFAHYGDTPNTLAIRVDAQAMEGWWYEGAGIYRHTWLVKRSPLHITTDGVFAHPVRKPDGTWEIPVETTLSNIGDAAVTGGVQAELIDPDGKSIASGRATVEVPSLDTAVAKFTIPVSNPKLWSVDTPTLYTVRTRALRDGVVQDSVETRCGFRTIRFDAKLGFFLNDKPLKFKGTCNHQDHAGVGVAVPDSIWEFRVRRLKELGSNAYRCAHNPPAKEFLEACDRLGMLVMDENRNFNVSPEYVRQLEWLIRRDRNHPSVILWSVFNEETTQGTEMGYQMVRRMAAVVKRLDSTRPVTAAMSGGHKAPINVSQAVDVVGFNYNQDVYDEFHKAHPDLPVTSSEDTSGFMTRGVYETDHNEEPHRFLRRPARAVGCRPIAMAGARSPSGHSSPAASSGPASTTAASRLRWSGRPPDRSSASWTSADFPRPPTISIRRIGSRTSRCST